MKKRINYGLAVLLSGVILTSPVLTFAAPSNRSRPISSPKGHKPFSTSTFAGAKRAARAQTRLDLQGQTATPLSDGRTLFIGGEGANEPQSSVFISDPRNREITPLANGLQLARAWHSATMLPDGKVLVLGGVGAAGRVISAPEIYDPETRTSELLTMPGLAARAYHTATLLTTGQVLVVGGGSGMGRALVRAELFDSRTRTAVTLPGRLINGRQKHKATLLFDGNVVFEGGVGNNSERLSDAELYDTDTRSFNLTSLSSETAEGTVPYMSASLPADGATNVPVDSRVALRFSKQVPVEILNSQTVKLTSAERTVDAKVVAAEGGRLAFVTPRESLLGGSSYTLVLNNTPGAIAPLTPAAISFTTVGERKADPPLPDADWIPQTDNTRGNWKSNLGRSGWEDQPPLQAEPGVTALSGQVLTLLGKPLANVTISINGNSAQTDETGRFLLSSLSAGHSVLLIDGRTASRPQKVYGIFRAGVDITSGQTNVLPYTIWMPRLDMGHAVNISSPTTTDVVITNPLIPGLELHLPPGTVIRDLDGQAVTQISITPVPTDRPPFPLPPGFHVPVFASIQPGGARVIPPRARLIYPNYTNERPGGRINFWNYDPEGKGWYIYGQGTVTADGRQIVPDPGVVIYEFTGIMIGSGGAPPPNGPEPGDDGDKDGEPVDLSTGLFVFTKTDLALPDTLPITLSRTYRQEDNTSRAFGIGSSHPYEMFLWSVNNYQEADLILPDGGRIHYVRISPGTGFGDAVYEHTATPSAFYKSLLSWNGNGWDLKLKDGTVYVFPDFAPLKSIRDRYGNQVTITRSGGATGNITQITSPNGRWLQFTYDPSNRITQAKDNAGRTVNYTYDAGGRLWKVTDPKDGVTEYTYNSFNRMLTIKDARQITYLTNEYGANGRIIKQTQADTSTYDFAYTLDAGGKIIQTDVTDPRANVRRLTFNSNGYTLTDTLAFGESEQQTTTYERDAASNRIVSMIDGLGRKTTYSYDPLGNVTSIVQLADTQSAATTQFTYELTFNQVATITDPLNHTTTFSYDSHGSLTGIDDALNHQTTLAYNQAGQPTSMTDALQHSTQFIYDGGDLVEVRDPLGRSVYRFVDAAGRLLRITNALGQFTKFEYDKLNKITKITDPSSGVTLFAYDPNGNPLSVTDANNHITAFSYDNMDRISTRTDPLQGTTSTQSYEYDLAGNTQKFTDRRGKVTRYEYDALNRPIFTGFGTIGAPPTATYESTITYSYDAANRLVQAADSWSGTLTRNYNEQARTISETSPQGTVSYAFDAAGRRTQMSVTGQQPVIYDYDNANRMVSLTQGTANVSFVYDNANRRTSVTLPSGNLMEYTYDNASQLIGMIYKNGANVIGNLTYEYNGAGRRTKIGGSFGRTALPQTVTTATHNAANQLTQRGGSNLTYDANGNLTSDGSNSYSWNSRNQLVSITGSITASFQYDAFGRRINKTVGGTSVGFLYDGANIVQEQSVQLGNANILSGGMDEVFTRTESTGAYSLLTDGLLSTLALVNGSGVVQSEYSYEAFGGTSTTGSPTNNASQYTGRENDGTGLYYYRARYYSPTLQRFISEDPIGFGSGDFNVYVYVRNSPLNFVDPSGQTTLQVGISGNLIYGIGALAGSVGIAIDGSGNVGIYYEGGGGLGAGGKGSVGVAAHTSTGGEIYDLEGPFTNVSVGAGKGVAASVDGFTGLDRSGRRVLGGGFTFGGGAGVGGSSTVTTTKIPFSFNIGREWCRFKKGVENFVDDIERGVCKLYGGC